MGESSVAAGFIAATENFRPEVEPGAVEFVLIAIGIFAGQLWIRLLVEMLRRSDAVVRSPGLQFLAHLIAAVITGALLGWVETSLSGRLGSALVSKGALAGFLWSTWFVQGARVVYRRRRAGAALGYLIAAPTAVTAGLAVGYLSLRLGSVLT